MKLYPHSTAISFTYLPKRCSNLQKNILEKPFEHRKQIFEFEQKFLLNALICQKYHLRRVQVGTLADIFTCWVSMRGY